VLLTTDPCNAAGLGNAVQARWLGLVTALDIQARGTIKLHICPWCLTFSRKGFVQSVEDRK
jgi:hypothetical protein